MKPLISLADLKSLLPIRPTSTEFDPRCKVAILSATAQIESGLRRSFARKEYTQFETSRLSVSQGIDLWGTSDDGLMATIKPQTFSLSGIAIDTTQPVELRYDPGLVFGDDTIIDPARYTLDAEAATIAIRYPTRHAPKAFRLTYTAGLPATEKEAGWFCLSDALVDDYAPVKLACQMQAMHLFNKSSPETIGKVADGTDGKKRPIPFQVPGGLLPDVADLVKGWRRLSYGRS